MAIIKTTEGCLSLVQRGKIGDNAMYGKSQFGVSLYGLSFLKAGIYQMRKIHAGEAMAYRKWKYKKSPILMKIYRPTYRRTEAQATRRDLFASAVQQWQNLTTEQKSVYNKKAIRKSKTGYNIFIKEIMTS